MFNLFIVSNPSENKTLLTERDINGLVSDERWKRLHENALYEWNYVLALPLFYRFISV